MTGEGAQQRSIIELAEQMAARLEHLGPQIADRIIAAVPELRDDDEIQAALVANAIAHVRAMLALARTGTPTDGIQPPAQAVHFARMMVHRDVPLPAVLRCYHVGQKVIWHEWFTLVCGDLQDADLVRLRARASTDFLSEYLDSVREKVTAVYEEEREAWHRSRSAVREGAIRDLLDGDTHDIEDVGRRLRHGLDRVHVAMALQPGRGTDPAARQRELEETAATVTSSLGTSPPLLMTATDGTLYAWASAPEVTDTDAVRRIVLPADCRGGLGEPGHGPEGFRASHEQAMLALRVAPVGSGAPGVTLYGDVALAAALLDNPAAAHRFAAHELAGLTGDDAGARDLRNTLECFLREDASQKRAARCLAMHEKTVAHRLRRAEAALAQPITGRRAALQCALLVWRTLPPR